MHNRFFDGVAPKPETEPRPVVDVSLLFTDSAVQKKWYTARLNPKHHKIILTVLGVVSMAAVGFTTIITTNHKTLSTAFAAASNGVTSLFAGMTNVLTRPDIAAASFSASNQSFMDTATQLRELNSVSKALFVFPTARDGLAILQVGHHASLAGEAFARVLADQPELPAPTSVESAASNAAERVLTIAANHGPDIADALSHLSAMQDAASTINSKGLPSGISQQVARWQSALPTMLARGQAAASLLTETPDLFGLNGERRYVILFQNNTELRPTGGFIGTYAVMTFNKGKVTDFTVQTNIYKADHAFANRTPITPPYPISEATTVWGMRDANWAVDFRESAKQVLDFHQGIYGKPAHGVIALDTSVVLDLLRLTGPIAFPEYNTTLDADNFIDVVQYKVEKEYFQNEENKQTNEPKTIIADFIPKLFAAVTTLPDDKKQTLPTVLWNAVERKSVQAYSINQKAEQSFIDLGIDGRVKDASSDYLYINNANIGGGKSSKNMVQETAMKQQFVGGRIENILTITRTHRGTGQWPDGDNSNYMRILVPKGSELMSTDGAFELHNVGEEAGKTVIEGWFTTPVASKKNATIRYRLPTEIARDNYSLFIQRQPGENVTSYTFDSPFLKTRTWELRTDSAIR